MKNAIRRMTTIVRRQEGSSFVDVLIALSILGIIGTVFLSGVWTSTRASAQAEEMVTMDNLARAQMEYVKSYPFQDSRVYPLVSTPGSPGQIAVPSGYSLNVNATSYYDGTLQQINVVVSHGGRTRTLIGYKTDR